MMTVLAFATPLAAHAILVSTAPAPAQQIEGPNLPIRLRFNSRIDAKRSRLTLVSPDGAVIPLTILAGEPPDRISADAKGLKRGAYILQWQVLASDGHITRGEVRFRVQ